jgi:hypothetical protein
LTTLTPEEKARECIDGMLIAAGWLIQNRADANIDAGRGVAIREFALGHGFGEADSVSIQTQVRVARNLRTAATKSPHSPRLCQVRPSSVAA